MPPLSFSIVIPTYQRKALVTTMMGFLGKIRYAGDWEVIVVVDGSTDGTAQALRELALPVPLRVIEQPNGGQGEAKNRGAAAARSDVLLFLDDDIRFQPDILDQYAAVFAAGADAASGDITLGPGSLPGFATDDMAAWLSRRSTDLAAGGPLSPFDVCAGNFAIRRALFEQLGGFDPWYTAKGGYGCEDVDIGIRVIDAGGELKGCPGARVEQIYDIGPAQIIRRTERSAAAELNLVRKHPRFAGEIRALRRAEFWRTKFLVGPLGRFSPGIRTAARVAGWLAERRNRLPPWAARRVPAFFWRIDNLVYWSAMRRLGGFPASREVLALCYHAIADLADDPVMGEYGIPRACFVRQIDSLLARGYSFVSPGEVAALLAEEGRVPRRAVLLTFDDCYVELADIAREVLSPRDVPALAFAVAGQIGGSNVWDLPNGARALRLVDEQGLRVLAQNGVEVGCHSMSHSPLPTVPSDRLDAETAGAADALASTTGTRPRFFAYPYGAANDRSRQAVRAAGYSAAFGIQRGKITHASDPFELERLCIVASHTGWRFRLATRWPGFGAWLEDNLLRLQIQRRLFVARLQRLVGGGNPRSS